MCGHHVFLDGVYAHAGFVIVFLDDTYTITWLFVCAYLCVCFLLLCDRVLSTMFIAAASTSVCVCVCVTSVCLYMRACLRYMWLLRYM